MFQNLPPCEISSHLITWRAAARSEYHHEPRRLPQVNPKPATADSQQRNRWSQIENSILAGLAQR